MKTDLQIRVYYEDTDAGGVVYHSNYIKFCERGRTELLRTLGFENKSLGEDRGILFVVRHLEADYLHSAYLDDLLTVTSRVIELKNASFAMQQDVFCGKTHLFSMAVWLVCINLKGRPVRVPDDIRKVLEKE